MRLRFAHRRCSVVLFVLVWLFLLGAALRVGNSLSSGDDPHYLVAAESLLQDQDVLLLNNYEGQGYRAFFPVELEHHHTYPGTSLPIHTIGLSVLVAPAYGLAGRPGVIVLLTGLLAFLVAGFHMLLSSKMSAGPAAALSLGLCAAPFVFTSMTVFPELPAAMLVFYFFAALFILEKPGHVMAAVVAAGLLPWLHTKFVLVTAACDLIALLWLLERRHQTVVNLGRIALSLGFQVAVVASFLGWNRWVGIPLNHSADGIKFAHGEGVPGLWLDASFGLLPYAPIFILFVPGLVLAWRRDPLGGFAAVALLAAIYFPPALTHFWYGGYSLPARLILPCVPLVWWISCQVFVHSSARRWFYGFYGLAGAYSLLVVVRAVLLSHNLFQGYPQLEGRNAILAPLQLQALFPSVTRSSRFDLAVTFAWIILTLVLTYFTTRHPSNSGASTESAEPA